MGRRRIRDKVIEHVLGRLGVNMGWEIPPIDDVREKGRRIDAAVQTNQDVWVRLRSPEEIGRCNSRARDVCFGGLSRLSDLEDLRRATGQELRDSVAGSSIEVFGERFKKLDPYSREHFYSTSEDPNDALGKSQARSYVFACSDDVSEPGPAVLVDAADAVAMLRELSPYCCILEEVDPRELSVEDSDSAEAIIERQAAQIAEMEAALADLKNQVAGKKKTKKKTTSKKTTSKKKPPTPEESAK